MTLAVPDATGAVAPGTDRAPLLDLRGLEVQYTFRRSWLSRGPSPVLRAVDGVDLAVAKGEAFGLVGESGCGKSTLARAIVGLQEPTAGEIRYAGERIDRPRPSWVPRKIQIVFQDPYSSLNPRMTVGQVLGEMLGVHHVVPADRVDARIDELLALVGLTRSTRHAYPRQLSGGQRQRVGIARALSLEPEVLVADEPVSALDVSVQATILSLLQELRAELGLTLLLIAHDLAVVRQVCDRVAVMYLGRIVEEGPADLVFADPRHPYTQALLRAVPSLHPGRRRAEAAVPGEPPSPFALPPGCRFEPRCPMARRICVEQDPPFVLPPVNVGRGSPDRLVRPDVPDRPAGSEGPEGPAPRAACHFAWRAPKAEDGPLTRSAAGSPDPTGPSDDG